MLSTAMNASRATREIMRLVTEARLRIEVAPAHVRDPAVIAALNALTAELSTGGYTADETFGYSVEQLEQARVYLVEARVAGRLVGVAGIELQGAATAELKRFYVEPECRRRGVADALIGALLTYAARRDASVVRLETGDKQKAAIAFYRRHGFVEVPRFEPYLDSATSVCMQRELASGGAVFT
jgi:putative acetyltransferase